VQGQGLSLIRGLPSGRKALRPRSHLGQVVRVALFERFDNPGVEQTAVLLEEPPVGHLMRQGMLKGVHRLGKGLRLIEELGVLEDTEVLMESSLGTVHDRLEQRERHVVADDSSGLQQPLCLGGQAVDTRRQHGLDGLRDKQGGVFAVLFQCGLRQFLQEKGIPRSFGDNLLDAPLRQWHDLGQRLHDDAARLGW
jgi:hypothetical protein